MKFLSFLPILAASALATDSSSTSTSDPSSSTSISSASSSSTSSSSSQKSQPPPAANDPTPLGEIWTPKWSSPLPSTYTTHCSSSTTHTAAIYTLGELYPTLKDYAPQLKVFYNKQHYPGSWSGVDKHGNDRELIKMEYEDLPYAVREWIKKNEKQRFFSVQDGVVFFAPGAIYPILPLWVEEVVDGGVGGECEGLFEDLEIYSAEAKDGAVIAKVEHKSTGKNGIEFTVEAMQVRTKADKQEQEKDEL